MRKGLRIAFGWKQQVGQKTAIDYLTYNYNGILMNKNARQDLAHFMNINKDIYIRDVYHPQEAEYLRKLGFTLVEINRKNPMYIQSDPFKIKWTYRITNNGDINDFYGKLDHLMGILNNINCLHNSDHDPIETRDFTMPTGC